MCQEAGRASTSWELRYPERGRVAKSRSRGSPPAWVCSPTFQMKSTMAGSGQQHVVLRGLDRAPVELLAERERALAAALATAPVPMQER
jgi:hypothetical protein